MAKPSYLDPDVPTIYYDDDTGEVVSEISSVPPGTVAYFSLASAPDGWLKANGATVSRDDYASLFTAIGTIYGAGDGSSTFVLPDLRGEFIRSLDDGRGVTSGSLGGKQNATRVYYNNGRSSGYNNGQFDIDPQAGQDYEGSVERTNTSSATLAYGGGGTAAFVDGIRVRPRNMLLLACIKY